MVRYDGADEGEEALDGPSKTKKYNLKELLAKVVGGQPGIEEIYLFGSRAYSTGSLRSDCDLLVRINSAQNTKC